MVDRTYLRISLDTAASGSIGKQRSRLAKVAVDPIEYADESVSGSKIPFRERPAGARLLADLERGDRVLVTKIDRAARNVVDLLDVVRRVEAAGASIVFVDQAIDTAGPMGRFLLTLLGAVAELEAEIIAERRRESLAAFREEGRHAVGSAPFGLRSVPNPTGRGLVLRPDPEAAPLLREAVERVLAGESQARVAEDLRTAVDALNADALAAAPDPEQVRARSRLGAPAFSRLLRNERLAGILGREADGSPRVDPEAAVFTLAEWDALQRHLARPAKAWTRAEGYGAALACGVCGDRLYLNVAKRREHSVYRCRRVKHAADEPGVSVIAANADRVVEEDFLGVFGRLPVTEAVVVSTSDARAHAVAAARLRLDAAKRAQDAAATEDEEEAAFGAYRAAKRALRDAEALPDESVVEYRETGETFAAVWGRSGADVRTALLRRAGRWVVAPGRIPLAAKIHREHAEPDYVAGEADFDPAAG